MRVFVVLARRNVPKINYRDMYTKLDNGTETTLVLLYISYNMPR